MKFRSLPYGARFKYKNNDKIWIKMVDSRTSPYGLIVEYDEDKFREGN